MTIKFKEINVTKEFEYNGYEYVMDYSSEKFVFWCDFHFQPAYSTRAMSKTNCAWFDVQRSATVGLTKIGLQGSDKDLYLIIGNGIIERIEKHILEDLMK
jgi:hypothetical protein